MAQQVELAPAGVGSGLREGKVVGTAGKPTRSYSAKRVVTTVVVALLFTLGVIVGLNYLEIGRASCRERVFLSV